MRIAKIHKGVFHLDVPGNYVKGLKENASFKVYPEDLVTASVVCEDLHIHTRKYSLAIARLHDTGSGFVVIYHSINSASKAPVTRASVECFNYLASVLCSVVSRFDEWAEISLDKQIESDKDRLRELIIKERELMASVADVNHMMVSCSDGLDKMSNMTLNSKEHKVALSLMSSGYSVREALMAAKSLA